MKYQIHLYLLTAKTNLHPGSGNQNYGIIDNLVQRDPASGHPLINASSLKGALREFFHQQTEADIPEDGINSPMVRYIFGADVKDETPQDKQAAKQPPNQAGAYRFMDAQLLSLPVRSNAKPFFRATCPALIRQLLERLEDFGLRDEESNWQQQLNRLVSFGKEGFFDPVHFNPALNDVDFYLEDFDLKPALYDKVDTQAIAPVLGEDVVLVNDKVFNRLTNDNHLPVIARNSLEDGRSANLWYEQVLPRQSRFAFFVMVPDEVDNQLPDFNQHLKGHLIQLGANASIGYGLTKIEPYSLTAKTATHEG